MASRCGFWVWSLGRTLNDEWSCVFKTSLPCCHSFFSYITINHQPYMYIAFHYLKKCVFIVIYPWTGPASEPGNQLFAQRNPRIVREFVLCALRYARSMDCARNPWIVMRSMDPWFAQIHTLRPTYIICVTRNLCKVQNFIAGLW